MQSWTFNGHMNIETWFLRCRVLVPFWVGLKKTMTIQMDSESETVAPPRLDISLVS